MFEVKIFSLDFPFIQHKCEPSLTHSISNALLHSLFSSYCHVTYMYVICVAIGGMVVLILY